MYACFIHTESSPTPLEVVVCANGTLTLPPDNPSDHTSHSEHTPDYNCTFRRFCCNDLLLLSTRMYEDITSQICWDCCWPHMMLYVVWVVVNFRIPHITSVEHQENPEHQENKTLNISLWTVYFAQQTQHMFSLNKVFGLPEQVTGPEVQCHTTKLLDLNSHIHSMYCYSLAVMNVSENV